MTVRREVPMICVNEGRGAGETACRRCEGMESKGKVVGWLERISLETSSSVRGEKAERGWSTV